MGGGHLTRIYKKWIVAVVAATVTAVVAACGGAPASPATTTQTNPDVDALAASLGLGANDPTVASFTSPIFGAVGTGRTMTFAWSAVTGATGYELQVGTTAGGTDLFESGVVTEQTLQVSSLPATGIVYARVRAIVPGDPVDEPAGHWIHGSDVVFRSDVPTTGAAIQPPAGGSLAPGTPLVWNVDPVALGYRLTLGTTPGGTDIDDSGLIRVDRRLTPPPAAAATVYATLDTIYTSVTLHSSISFTATAGAVTGAARLAVAGALTGEIRGMGNVDNQPYAGTLLFSAAAAARRGAATCTDYTTALLGALSDANSGLDTRHVDVCLNPNSFDCHELVEALNPDNGRWVTFDATFGLTTLGADGTQATTDEISAAARALNWTSLQFQYLTPQGNAYATGYYIDYPLLFVHVYTRDGAGFDTPVDTDLSAYFTNIGTSVSNAWDSYSLQCASGFSSATTLADGTVRIYPCTGGTGVTQVFFATSLSPAPGDTSLAAVLRANRFVF